MGRIKGWKKSRQQENMYNHGDTVNQNPDGYLKIHRKDNKYFILVKKPKQPEVRVNLRIIDTKDEALNFAIKYMKAHPEG